MRAWQFRQKSPGFGISKNYYLTVLAATAQLPTIRQVVDPKGVGGAVEGFGAPLAQNASKEDLLNPMERGIYAITTRNRETVLRMMVMPKEEAGFDPAPFLRSKEADKLTSEHLARISATWTLLQLTFETHESMLYASLKFMLSVAQRMAELTEGVVSDPICRSYKLPQEVMHNPPLDEKIDARDHITIAYDPDKSTSYSLGFQKFSLPELEISMVPEVMSLTAERFLLGVSQGVLMGHPLKIGRQIGNNKAPFQVATGGLDRALWEGIPCFELIPAKKNTALEGLLAWSEDPKQ
ncbi:MAG TPA: hypothetical protein VGL56_07280 [Fimbriimonadaceae bacterium]|jgi:hypothetical protein